MSGLGLRDLRRLRPKQRSPEDAENTEEQKSDLRHAENAVAPETLAGGSSSSGGSSKGSASPEAPESGLILLATLTATLVIMTLAVPAEVLRDFGVYTVLAVLAGTLFGAAVPDAFERERSFVAGIFGDRGRAVGRLVRAAGYRCTRYTHSLGTLLCLGLVLAPAPLFFGQLVGGGFAAGALVGCALHLAAELAFTQPPPRPSPTAGAEEPAARMMMLWPVDPKRGFPGLGLCPASARGRRGLYAAFSIVGVGAGVALLSVSGVGSLEDILSGAGAALAAIPSALILHFSSYPLGLAGVALYGVLLWFGAAFVMPRVYRRVAVAARDDESRRFTGGLECYALKPYSDARFDPRRFARVLEELPLGDEGQVAFAYQVDDQVRTVIGGRGIWEAAAAVDAAYGDLTLVPLSTEEAWAVPPIGNHGVEKEESGQPGDLVPVAVDYEVDGELAELGLRSLEDFDLRDADPLSGPLTNLQNAVSPKDGERAMLMAHVREAATEDGKPVFLARAISLRDAQDQSLQEQKKLAEEEAWREREEERTRRYKESRESPGSAKQSRATPKGRGGSGTASGAGWEQDANAALEEAVGVLLRITVFVLLLLPRLVFGLLVLLTKGVGKGLSIGLGRGKKAKPGSATGSDDAGSKERRAEECRTITNRLAGRSLCVSFTGVAYIKNGPDVGARVRRVEAAYERYFAAFGRRGSRGGACLIRRGSPGASAGQSSRSSSKQRLRAGETELRLVGPGRGPSRGPASDGPVVTTGELAALLHPLGKEVEVHGREVGSVLAIPPPPAMTPSRMPKGRSSIEIARSNHASYLDTPVDLTFDELRTHGGITGGTGYGKSSLQYRIIESAWESGLGIALLDPKMDFFACVISNLSPRRLKQAIVVDAGHEAPVPAYNLLVCPDKIDTAQRAATLLEGLKKRFPANAFQGRNSNYFMMSFRALIGANMARIRAGERSRYVLPDLATGKFLASTDDATGERPYFRAEVLEHLDGIAEFEDVLDFFTEFDKLKAATQQEHVQSVTNKIGPLAGAQVRRFLGAPGQDFDMRTAIEEGLGIFLNLSKHVFPGGAAALVGTLFFSDIIAAAKARHWEATMRGTQDAMRDFLIAADEVQNFTCPEMVEILAEARAYRTPIWFGHQYAAQIKDEDLREAMAQAATHAYFNQTPKDSGYIAPILGDPFTKERLSNMPKYNFVIKAGEKIATCQTIPLPHTDPVRANEVRRASSERYASGDWAPELALDPQAYETGEPPAAHAGLEPVEPVGPDAEGVIWEQSGVTNTGVAGTEVEQAAISEEVTTDGQVYLPREFARHRRPETSDPSDSSVSEVLEENELPRELADDPLKDGPPDPNDSPGRAREMIDDLPSGRTKGAPN